MKIPLAVLIRVCRAALTAGVVLAVAGPGSVSAQHPPLGEVARKEAERRKTLPPSAKVYTNKDLPASAQGRGAANPAGTETTIPLDPVAVANEQNAQAEAKAAAANRDEKDEAWWRTRISQAREELRRNEIFAEALQSRINALNRDFVNRDNPVQRARLGEERAEALNELARVQQELENGKKQIADIEEEARKAGVPPGWLR